MHTYSVYASNTILYPEERLFVTFLNFPQYCIKQGIRTSQLHYKSTKPVKKK